MTTQPVSAVWWWKFTKTPFKATYGRVTGADSYSKDFLQVSGSCAKALEKLVCGGDTAQRTEIQFVWPGGQCSGSVARASDYSANGRLELRWKTNNAPKPWQLTETPTDQTESTLPGTPGELSSETVANAQWSALETLNLDPWLVVVQLKDSPTTLHVRTYLGNAQKYGYASMSHLPCVITNAIDSTKNGCGVFEAKPVRAEAIVGRILEALKTGPNVLLVGPPGTGKTVALEDLRELYETGGKLGFDPTVRYAAWCEIFTNPKGPVRSVVFHPSYTYEDLVLGLLPDPTRVGVGVRVNPGPLLGLAHYASQPDKSALLMIDEFNRGNAAAIFGDTLALLDADKRTDQAKGIHGGYVDRPYPHLEVRLPTELSTDDVSGDCLGSQITLPRSLSIVVALNSSDRSVAPLDAALRRRFSIIPVDPDYDVLAEHFGVQTITPGGDITTWGAKEVLRFAVTMLEKLNERIELVSGADFLLGHAHLWHLRGGDRDEVAASLAMAFDERIIGTLRLSFADHDEGLAAVLNAGTSDTPNRNSDCVAEWVLPPTALEHVAAPRLRTSPVQNRDTDGILRALVTLL